jgi:hypothetical protein
MELHPAKLAQTRPERRANDDKGSAMAFRITSRLGLAAACIAIGAAIAVAPARAVELDPKAVIYKLPDQIDWKGTGGNRSAVLVGDPAKPGLYIVINKWLAGNNFSRPHFHPNDRFITVLKGTWWVGSGRKFDPANTVPMREGTFVTHFGGQVHWDGAKDEDAILLIVGDGPATNTRVEEEK